MLDAFIPEGALSPDAEKALLSKLTDLLLFHEGADPADPAARSIAWIFVHHPAAVFVAGAPADAPRYRLFPRCRRGSTTTSAGGRSWRQ